MGSIQSVKLSVCAGLVMLACGATPNVYADAMNDSLPSFLESTNASMLSSAEMREVQGEGYKIPKKVRDALVKKVGQKLGKRAAERLEALLLQAEMPSFSDYRRAFGTKTAVVLSLLPSYLKPRIAESN